MRVNYYPEICCEECNEVIHNHFDCPVCKTNDAKTSVYGQIHAGYEISCQSCCATFTVVKVLKYRLDLKRKELV